MIDRPQLPSSVPSLSFSCKSSPPPIESPRLTETAALRARVRAKAEARERSDGAQEDESEEELVVIDVAD